LSLRQNVPDSQRVGNIATNRPMDSVRDNPTRLLVQAMFFARAIWPAPMCADHGQDRGA
jgi:hypothetical protein